MAETIKGITVVLGADTTALGKALGDVNKRSKDIQSELRQVDRLLKFDSSDTVAMAQKQELLSKAIENTSDKLKKLRDAQWQVKEQFEKGDISEGQYRAFERELISTEQNLKSLEKQLEATSPDFEELGNEAEKASERLQQSAEKIKKAGEGITNAGKSMSMYVTAPIVALGTLSAKAAIDFESAFAGVRKTVDATEEEFAALEKGIRDMSKQMPASASDIAAVGEAAGQLGIETGNILKFTETMIGLGEATNISAEEGATQFARFANIVGMSQGDFDKLGSSVVALGNNFATTEAEIVAMGMRLAGQGKQLNMSESQIMALAAAMSSVGIEAEAGGTAMSTSLKKMQLAVDEAGADLEGFAKVAGMTSKEFADLFKEDSASALTAFVKGLSGAANEGANLSTILSDLGIKGIRESDTLLRLAGASDVLADALNVSSDAWEENTALANEVAQRYATTESQMAMLKNQIVDIAIQLGDILIPIIRDVITAIQPWIQKFSEMDEGSKKTILTIAGIAAAIGPLLIVIGKVVSAIGTLMPILGAISGPIGWIITAIVALIAVFTTLYKKNEEFRDFVNETWTQIKDTFTSVIKEIVDFAKPILEDMKDFFGEILGKIKEFWDENGAAIMAGIKIAFEFIVGYIKIQLAAIQMVWKVAWEVIKAVIMVVWEFIKMHISNVIDIITGIIDVAMKILKGDWEGAWNSIKNTVEKVWNNIMKFFKNLSLKDVGKNLIQGLIDGISSMINKVGDVVKNITDKIKGIFKKDLEINSPSKLTEQIGVWTGEGLVNGMKRTVQAVSQQASQLASAAIPNTQQGDYSANVNGSSGGSGIVFNMDGLFNGANFSVRSDDDIKALAKELAQEMIGMYHAALRGAGV